ncbi:TonB-dependent receptor [Candidatus Albibeggiatoa sp. nov. NOAA]|uniref:TonB-dependent receptor domain-containing protein n=1 Tax=Candidatus Albibeggiatoa sp. nov. NOAA TaxID=3162724 RepID=UPI003304A69D|nr:TonB-dependent receptor [Thiotrichaceae bacterium]
MKKLLVGLMASSIPFVHADELLPEVVVTAARSAQTIDETLASVSIITREEIQQSQAIDLPNLLQGMAGVDITRSGGAGQTSSVFLRGTESDHTLILLDGVKISSATLGTSSIQHIPLAQVERIEIVRGARSALYGSEAIGGVIQIFTRKAKLGKPQISAQLGAGSDNHYQASVHASHRLANSWLSVTANHDQTDGFNACKGSLSAGCFTVEPDDDGYKNSGFNLNAGYQLDDSNTVEFTAMRTQGNVEYDSSFGGNETDFVEQIVSVNFDSAVNDSWVTKFKVSNFIGEQESFGNGATTPSIFDTERYQFTWQNDIFIGDNHTFNFGYDFQDETVKSNTAYLKNERDNQGFFAQYQAEFGAFSAITSLRYDDNQQFGSHTTGHINLGYEFTPNLRLMAAYGTAFKAPSFNELYYPFFGNPNVEPEEADSYELGLLGQGQGYQWAVNVYHTEIEKLIATNYDPVTQNYFADNIDEAEITGIDASLKWQWQQWTLNTQLTWLKPEDKTTDLVLARRAEKSAKIAIARQLGQAQVGAEWIAQSHRFDDKANQVRLAGYGLLNLTASYTLQPNWTFNLKVSNVLDKDYELARAYNTEGRSFFASVRYQY